MWCRCYVAALLFCSSTTDPYLRASHDASCSANGSSDLNHDTTSLLQTSVSLGKHEAGYVMENRRSARSLDTAPPRLFPFVQKMSAEGGCCSALTLNVRVLLQGNAAKQSPVLRRAASRAQATLRKLADNGGVVELGSDEDADTTLITEVHVRLTSPDSKRPEDANFLQTSDTDKAYSDALSPKSSYDYNISCSDGRCVIDSPGTYGAIGALESTLPQLFGGQLDDQLVGPGRGRFRSISIADWPNHPVRGLMVDLGRRFVPMEALKKEIVNGMSFMRMNVLQLHLNDFCRFSLALPGFPELQHTDLLEGHYSGKEMQELIAYANDRGVRVVPELDVPGHANALLPLKSRGLHFCEPTPGTEVRPEGSVKIFDDPKGESRKVLLQLFGEVSAIFGEEVGGWLHLGGDEANPVGLCTMENQIALEKFVSRDIIRDTLHKTPVGWEELLLKPGPESDGESATGGKSSIIVNWENNDALHKILYRGHRAIDASIVHHYLDADSVTRPASDFWYDPSRDPGRNLVSTEPAMLLGGLSAMWTDKYTYKYQCGAASESVGRSAGSLPNAHMLFAREKDDAFVHSISAMIWPRAGVSAAALWQYDKGRSGSLDANVRWIAEKLDKIAGVSACPAGCDCSELTQCMNQGSRVRNF